MQDHRGTAFRTVYYSSECDHWWPMAVLFKHLWLQPPMMDHENAQHFQQQVVWNTGLLGALITSIMRQITLEARKRKTAGTLDPVFVPGEMLVFVGFALNRLKVSFQFLVTALLSWNEFLVRYDLQESGLTPDMVSVRLANDSTGPTFDYGHVVRHPRYRGQSSVAWRLPGDRLDLQTEGDQAKDEIMYILLTRATKDCTLCLHTEPLGHPDSQRSIESIMPGEVEGPHRSWQSLRHHERLLNTTAK